MHLIDEDIYPSNDCEICRCGQREGIRWVDTERYVLDSWQRRKAVLICSSCIGETVNAVAKAVTDVD